LIAGIALLKIKLYSLYNEERYLSEALELVKPHLSQLRGGYKDCTFLCGDCGPLAIAAVIYHLRGISFKAERDACIKK